MWPWKRTPKPSEISPLLEAVQSLAQQLREQSQTSADLSEKFLVAIAEKDSQIRMVLESKFQPFVQMMPPRNEPKPEPESIEHLADVSEMSEASAETEAEKSTKAYQEATAELEKELADIRAEHDASHGAQS